VSVPASVWPHRCGDGDVGRRIRAHPLAPSSPPAVSAESRVA
jgi:hypothetical protein